MTTPEAPGAGFYIIEMSVLVNALAEELYQDKRWPTLAALVGKISTEWAGNPTQATEDANFLVTLAEAMKANYPTNSNVDVMLRYAQALAGIWESDILNQE